MNDRLFLPGFLAWMVLTSCTSGATQPLGLTVSPSAGATATLRWKGVPRAHYEVLRSEFFGDSSRVQALDAPFYQDTSVEPGSRHWYQIVAEVDPGQFVRSERVLYVAPATSIEGLQGAWTGSAVHLSWHSPPGAQTLQVVRFTEDDRARPHTWVIPGSQETLDDAEAPVGLTSSYTVRVNGEDPDYRYGALALASVSVPGVPVVTAPKAPGSASDLPVKIEATPTPVERTVSVPLEGWPDQQVTVVAPSTAWAGVVLVVGQGLAQLPNLTRSAGTAGWAVIGFGNWNFGSPEHPRLVTTAEDGRTLQLIDLRHLALSSRLLQSVLQTLPSLFPQAQNVARLPLAGWAFSQTDVGLTQVLARPEWVGRVVAMVHADALEVEPTTPVFPFTRAAQLFVLSGRKDHYSQLFEPPAQGKNTNRQAMLANLTARHGLAVTWFTNLGQGHAQGLDTEFQALWLFTVLNEASLADADRLAVGWVGSYKAVLTSDAPWGDRSGPGVRFEVCTVEQAPPADKPWMWFPSKAVADAWASSELGKGGLP